MKVKYVDPRSPIKKGKRINGKKFSALAKKIREGYLEEERYWKEQAQRYGNNPAARFFSDS